MFRADITGPGTTGLIYREVYVQQHGPDVRLWGIASAYPDHSAPHPVVPDYVLVDTIGGATLEKVGDRHWHAESPEGTFDIAEKCRSCGAAKWTALKNQLRREAVDAG